jgi:hypothetical protein
VLFQAVEAIVDFNYLAGEQLGIFSYLGPQVLHISMNAFSRAMNRALVLLSMAVRRFSAR